MFFSKSVKSHIPYYYKDQSVQCNSYAYAAHIVTTFSPATTCYRISTSTTSSLSFPIAPLQVPSCIYNRTDHFIASNLNIPSNTSLLAKMLKYCVPKSIGNIINIHIDSVFENFLHCSRKH
jgi:hypothetical protein